MNKSDYLRNFEKNGGNSLTWHEYGHYLHFKHHFNYNFASYATHVGLPSIGSAAGMGTYGNNHSRNPTESTADILSAGFFRKSLHRYTNRVFVQTQLSTVTGAIASKRRSSSRSEPPQTDGPQWAFV
ncbi:hypothetical protein QWY85_10705 [Neolewinella lacunae]|uniref:Uncharacterized protein n=2 Tax=Neolewinella lacunae TaxID=1517758 RepID=A0A923PMB3_9BACT|nr:hypothetical protein [Neolewinella lacunae]MDN3635128.1 hypothetical protein [Neolewinella lacunae]